MKTQWRCGYCGYVRPSVALVLGSRALSFCQGCSRRTAMLHEATPKSAAPDLEVGQVWALVEHPHVRYRIVDCNGVNVKLVSTERNKVALPFTVTAEEVLDQCRLVDEATTPSPSGDTKREAEAAPAAPAPESAVDPYARARDAELAACGMRVDVSPAVLLRYAQGSSGVAQLPPTKRGGAVVRCDSGWDE